MIREVSLIEYLPPLMQEYDEIKKIMAAETPEFQLAWEEAEKNLNNLFVPTADENSIRRFERITDVYPTADDSLDTRRTRVLIRMNEQRPYTLRVLKKRLEAICGADGYQLMLDPGRYKLGVSLESKVKDNLDDVRLMLRTMVPVNLIVDLAIALQLIRFKNRERLSFHAFKIYFPFCVVHASDLIDFKVKASFLNNKMAGRRVLLNGERLLNGLWVLSALTGGGVSARSLTMSTFPVRNEFGSSLKQRYSLYVANKGGFSNTKQQVAGLSAKQKYDFKGFITMDNRWQLDGSSTLNGSKSLNPFYIKEDL